MALSKQPLLLRSKFCGGGSTTEEKISMFIGRGNLQRNKGNTMQREDGRKALMEKNAPSRLLHSFFLSSPSSISDRETSVATSKYTNASSQRMPWGCGHKRTKTLRCRRSASGAGTVFSSLKNFWSSPFERKQASSPLLTLIVLFCGSILIFYQKLSSSHGRH